MKVIFDFFISHSSADKENVVEKLIPMLKNQGYSVWYDKNEILAGDNINSQILNGLKNSYCLLLIITDNFVTSKWTIFETTHFDTIKDRRIIPVIDKVSEKNKKQLFDIIGNRKYIDMKQLNEEQIISELRLALDKTKHKNDKLVINDKLFELQQKLASYEAINSDFISIKLKDYLDLLNKHSDFAVIAAQKLVYSAVSSLLNYQGYKITDIGNNYNQIMEIINKQNIVSINIREYINFIFYSKCESDLDDYLKIINYSLINILTYYLHTRYPITPSYSKIEVVYPEDLTYSDFEDMYEIDKKVMRDDLIASIETTYGWYKYNNYTHIAVKDISNQKVVGYFAVLPITEETYQSILSGNFKDKDFNLDAINQYIFSDFYKIYVAGVGIDPEYQNTGAFIKLYNALIDLILSLAKDRDIFISEVLAEASTKQGEKFCKMIGMKKITHTNNETDVYHLITIPPQFRLKNQKGKELFRLCKEKYEEYREYFEKTDKL